MSPTSKKRSCDHEGTACQFAFYELWAGASVTMSDNECISLR